MSTQRHRQAWRGHAIGGKSTGTSCAIRHRKVVGLTTAMLLWACLLVAIGPARLACAQPGPAPRQILPPIPPSTTPQDQPRLPLRRVFVRKIAFTGATAFSKVELAVIAAPYVNRELTFGELEALRLDLTRLYAQHGYLNSGAIIPDQKVSNGVITLHIIEGELTDVAVTGNRWFRADYLRRRLALDITPPLSMTALQERLQRLQQDARIQRLQAELKPGLRLGEGVLHVDVEETLPFHVALEFNNHRSPSVGAERGLVTLAHRNLTGHGDILSATYGVTRDLKLHLDASYTLPLSARDTTLNLRYRRNDTDIVETSFSSLDITTTSEVAGITLRHPLYRALGREFALGVSAERLHSEAEFDLFSFTEKATHTALRFSQEWLNRSQRQVLAIRSRFSLGVAALGATISTTSDVPDGRFFAWLGQLQWLQRFGDRDIRLLFRLDVQLSTEPLLALEQIAVGGRFSVRGYRENLLVRDNGLIASIESQIPLLRDVSWAEVVQIMPFVDFGRGWNRNIPTPDPTILISLGLGLRWAYTWAKPIPWRAQLEVYWGHALKDVDTPGNDIQDQGLHIQWVMSTL